LYRRFLISGGSCKNCGSVEHYAKDCPTNQTPEIIEQNSKGVSKLKPNDNVEELVDDDEPPVKKRDTKETKPMKKVVVFK
jgi:hypothetical protein